MAKTSDGTRDQPQFASSGNTPDFAADLTVVSDFFAPRSLRRFSTVAALLASSGSNTDDYAIATNAPGALFRNTGSGWKMYGIPTFADSSARATALSAPAVGMVSRLLDTGLLYEYRGTSWVVLLTGVHRQLDTTNDLTAMMHQAGIGKITGGGTATATEAVTFPTAFATGTVPIVVVNLIGFRATGAFNAVALTSAAQSVIGSAQQPSNTGFAAYLYQSTGGNLSAGSDFYYSWMAIGVPA